MMTMCRRRTRKEEEGRREEEEDEEEEAQGASPPRKEAWPQGGSHMDLATSASSRKGGT